MPWILNKLGHLDFLKFGFASVEVIPWVDEKKVEGWVVFIVISYRIPKMDFICSLGRAFRPSMCIDFLFP